MAQVYAPYKCSLDADTQRKALEELYEDPKNRKGAIDTFRDWISQQKHIKCPMDDIFLLGFLRAKHFSQLEARESLENWMRHRDKLSAWMMNVDAASDDITSIIDKGVIMLLGRDREGRRVIMIKPAEIDLGDEAARLAMWWLFVLVLTFVFLDDELSQVHGTVFIFDVHKHTIRNDIRMPTEEKKHGITLMSKTYPARVKGLHFYGCGPVIEVMMTIFLATLNEKLKKRVYIHGSLESLTKWIPLEILPQEYLPDDYTGTSAGSVDTVKASMKKELCSGDVCKRIKHLTSDEFFIKMADKDTDVPAASFRKLNID